MKYTLNGEPRTAAGSVTVADVLEEHTGDAAPKGVAVAVNGEVVPASDWSRVIAEGDGLDILIAVQGG
ncbi:sulfur carrier protein ThiS [Corynebacterium falsenii]|uniref:Sulfur carrier protein ThiS n=1 Tax=Corynebacterium falsenii TaxID=108486 RepID=A0A418Q7S6_9CORY|nr:sulfur carrier protein ThiS [Corynebacterium falsenii]RIX35354.1 sulfur carrier protein ThiS [Corynebacterium falsenii]